MTRYIITKLVKTKDEKKKRKSSKQPENMKCLLILVRKN